MNATATRKTLTRAPWDIVRVADALWAVMNHGRVVDHVTDERVARILEYALGIRRLKHAANDVEVELGHDVWRVIDKSGVEDIPANGDRNQMAAALIACGYREVP